MGDDERYLAGSSSSQDNEEAVDLASGTEAADQEADAVADDDSSDHFQEADVEADGASCAGGEDETTAESASAADDASTDRRQLLVTGSHVNTPRQQSLGDAGHVTHSQELQTDPQSASGDGNVRRDGLQAAPGGSGIMDEYLRRMHFSKETPLPHPLPTPPEGLPTRASMPRRWSKTDSYSEGMIDMPYSADRA